MTRMIEVENEFSRIASSLWGYGWQAKAARHFEVVDRTARRWAAGAGVPENVMRELREMAGIAPARGSIADEDRDKMCRLALEPPMTALRNRAISAGWHPAEIAAAILALTVDEIRTHAGDKAAKEILKAAMP